MRHSMQVVGGLMWLTAGSVFGQTSLTFVAKAPLPLAHYGMAYCNDQVAIYQIGGGTPSTAYSNDVYRYDVLGNGWGSGVTLITPQRFGSAAILDPSIAGLVYVLNGGTASGTNMPVPGMESVMVSNGQSGPTLSNPLATVSAGAAVWNGVLYCYGGVNGTTYSNVLRSYDRLANTWTTLAPMPVARTIAGAAVNGKIYAFGGYDGLVNYSRVDAYDIATNQWQALPSLPTTVSNQAVAVQGEWIWLVGDFNNQSYLAAYNTRTAQLRTFTSNLTPRRNAGAAVINNQLYVWGGNTAAANSSALSDVWSANVSFLVMSTAAAARKTTLQAYPNPSASGYFRVVVPDAKAVELIVRDVRGQEVRKAPVARGTATYELDLTNQPTGLYLAEAQVNGQVIAQCRLMKR